MSSHPPKIFISYRRVDTSGHAGRLYDHLCKCDIMLVLIGPRWLDVKDDWGRRRLNNPQDFVRLEITAALEHDISIIPVLVQDTPLPKSDQLPDALRPLAQMNAAEIRHQHFDADVESLFHVIET